MGGFAGPLYSISVTILYTSGRRDRFRVFAIGGSQSDLLCRFLESGFERKEMGVQTRAIRPTASFRFAIDVA